MKKLILVMVTACLVCFVLGMLSSFALIQWTNRIPASATVKTVGVSVYQDANFTIPVTYISWGVLEPGQTINRSMFVVNRSNVPIVLSLHTENWNPLNASNFITLTWNLEGASVDVGGYRLATLTLHVSPAISGINSFSFDILIAGTG
jgi:hypothetical protein